jgi:3-hydroxyacyl-CoA dehydrogenase
MGSGIAQVAATKGIDVTLLDVADVPTVPVVAWLSRILIKRWSARTVRWSIHG